MMNLSIRGAGLIAKRPWASRDVRSGFTHSVSDRSVTVWVSPRTDDKKVPVDRTPLHNRHPTPEQ